MIRRPVISCSSSTTPISSGETNATSSTVSRTAIGQISRSTHSFSGSKTAQLLVDRAGLDVAVDHRKEQVVGVDAGNFLLGDEAGPDQGHFGQGAGLGLLERLLDLVEPLGVEPVAPRQQLEDQGSNAGVAQEFGHR